MTPTALHFVALAIMFLTGGFTALKGGDAEHAQLYAAIIAGLGFVSTVVAAQAPKLFVKKTVAKPPSLPCFCLFVLCLFVALGCIESAPIVAVTPANQAQVTACQATANAHNDWLVAGVGLGVAGSGVGAASTAITSSDTGAKTALGVAAVSTALLAAGSEVLAGFAASQFTASNCSSVVGPLPALPPPASSAKPSVADAPPPYLFPRPGESVVIVSHNPEVPQS